MIPEISKDIANFSRDAQEVTEKNLQEQMILALQSLVFKAYGAIVWRGEFNFGSAYKVNDFVSFENSLYICTQDNVGELLIEGFWDIMISAPSEVEMRVFENNIEWKLASATTWNQLIALPSKLSDLEDDATHRVITDAERINWNLAHGWGDHAGLYSLLNHNHGGVYQPVGNYLTEETDPIFNAWLESSPLSFYALVTHNHSSLYEPLGTSSGILSGHLNTFDHSLIATALQSETDPIFSNWLSLTPPLYSETDPLSLHLLDIPTFNLSNFNNDLGNYGGFLTEESDPIFSNWLNTTPPLYSESDPVWNSEKANYLRLDQTTPQTIVGTFTFPKVIATTDITTPLLIGGSAVGSYLSYKSTTGNGTSTGIAHQFLGGNNGATVAMTLLNNGNVGIGTTAPGGRLEIKSSSAGTDSQVIIQNDGTATGNSEIILRRTSAHQAVISNNPTLAKLTISQNHASGVIAFANTAALTERMRIDASGNVGIGTTNPVAKLDVNGAITVNGEGAGNGVVGAKQLIDTLNGGFTLHNSGGTGSARWWIDASGVQHLYNGNGTLPIALGESGVKVGIGYDSTSILAGSGALLINGNVGIGITTPTAKLDINSDILRLRTAKTPATAGASGNQGDLCWDADFLYICVATNTWKKVAIATW